ncbi:MAG: dienelactone hydrolase family protein [Gemmatimonadaceae bacterium]|nr:dienelactone hydrolase family protein [Gemmatimonadaceae bacterium]
MTQSIPGPPHGGPTGPHQGGYILTGGAPLDTARGALILTHGRGATAESIMSLAPQLGATDLAWFAPQASGNTWYPYSFLAPIADNEPGISSGVQALRDIVAYIEKAGIPAERIALAGFSQGACLTLEFVGRHARRYGAVAAFSGGLIGPEGTPRDYDGSLDGTPVLIGCSDADSHVPLARVHESTEVLTRLGAVVDERIYKGMGHLVNDNEIEVTTAMLQAMA